MLDRKGLKLRKYLPFSAMMAGIAGLGLWAENAQALTADDVLNKMSTDQRIGYIDGVVEGLATARWVSEKPDASGMNCIFDWYYQDSTETIWTTVRNWLERHPDKQVGVLMHVLIGKECPTSED